jgi:RNA polymerase sigma-70 factor (ECF subfamily)
MESSEMALGASDTAPALRGGASVAPPADRSGERRHARITGIVRAQHDFIWRLLRRLGIPESAVDDAAQHVFCIAARRIDDIAPGSERSFLFGTALRVASDQRRSAAQRERPAAALGEQVDPRPTPEELADTHRKRALLDEILDAMPLDLRTVLVLFELEQMTKTEVAELLSVPVGTAVSRLRRAREEFKAAVQRRRAREAFDKGRRP